MQPSVLLVRSDNVNGIGLRTILTQQDIRFVGDVTCLYRASQAAVVLRPDLILADALLANASLARFVAQLRDCSVHSKIVMLGNGLTGEELATLEQRGLNGYIRWDDLNAVVLRHCLTAVVEAGLQVNSPIGRERSDAAENYRRCGNSNHGRSNNSLTPCSLLKE